MKKLLYLLLLAAFVVNSCKKEELVTVNGIVHGYVMDYYNTTYLSGAQIQYKVGDEIKSVTSDSSGFYSISGLPPGEHLLTVSHTGYLTYIQYAWIEPLYDAASVKNGGKIDYVETVETYLPELSAGLTGTIKKAVGPNNLIQPAADLLITITVGSNYAPSSYSTTTNSSGQFSMSDLPAAYVQLTIRPQSDADNYYPYDYGSSLRLQPNETLTYNTTMNRTESGIYLTSTSLDAGNGVYRTDVAIDEDIVLHFSTNVSKEQTIAEGGITLSGIIFDPDVDFTFSGSQVTINPPSNLAADTDYTLFFVIYSTTPGDYSSATINFHTAP